jgi:hypothetical protein
VMRLVTVRGAHRRGATSKLGAAALILCLLAAEAALPPLALAGVLAILLAAVVFSVHPSGAP